MDIKAELRTYDGSGNIASEVLHVQSSGAGLVYIYLGESPQAVRVQARDLIEAIKRVTF